MKLEVTIHLDNEGFDAHPTLDRNDYVSAQTVAEAVRNITFNLEQGPSALRIGDRGAINAPFFPYLPVGEWRLV